VKWAALVLAAVVVQVALGMFGHEAAVFGLLHGINALLLFSLAVVAGRRVAVRRDEAQATAGDRRVLA
jgi:hypothetical protein